MPIVNLGSYAWRGEDVEELETNLVLMTLSESWIQPNLQLTLCSTSQLPRANTFLLLFQTDWHLFCSMQPNNS